MKTLIAGGVLLLAATASAAPAPNLSRVLAPLASQFALTTQAGCGRYTEAAAQVLHATDPAFGHLRVAASRPHVTDVAGNLHAVDVVLYRPNGQTVDLVRDCGKPTARPGWELGPENEYRDASDWYAPVVAAPEPPVASSVDQFAGTVVVDLSPVLMRLDALLSHIGANERQLNDLSAQVRALSERVEVANSTLQTLSARPIVSATPVTLPPAAPTVDHGSRILDITQTILAIVGPILSAYGLVK
jgi:hypothetical protein